ncbi:sensor histidine kinase [Actinoplanes awajinensis]|nr:histidine kinase [Actinoplanes awajinensis]
MATWLLPVLLAAGQLALLPLDPLSRWQNVTIVLASLAVAGGLGLRLRRPVGSLLVVSAALAVATTVVSADDHVAAVLLIGLADLIALFSVAARCPMRTMLLSLGGLVVWQGALSAVQSGVTSDLALEVLLSLAVNGMTAAFGRVRRRWHRDRAAAARRLAAAETAHREAAAEERGRLARELHDVTAHHLTSIVVNAQAADLLAEQRPELRDEALSFAARTGRDTLDALRRLVAILPADAADAQEEAPSLTELVAGFAQLGQQVVLDLPDGDPPGPLAGALHGIAREALTNTLRYAPGSTIKIRFWYGRDSAEFTVDDDGTGTEATGVVGLGGGRGVTGMRDRAQALGGTLTAGPRDGGGWRVRASLPFVESRNQRVNRWLRSQAVIDAGLVLLAVLLPAAGLFAPDSALNTAATLLVLAALIAHVVPLLWRRHGPWWVLLAVAATTWLGPLLGAAGVVGDEDSWVFLFSAGAEVIAVYAVAAYGVRPRLTWLAGLGAALSSALALSVLMVAVSAASSGNPFVNIFGLALLAVFTVLIAVLLAAPMFGSWAAGRAARVRRERRRSREESGVASATALAGLRARAERARFADGLRAAVLQHAAALPQAADRGDLPTVLTSAREALRAMRALLDNLTTAPARPAPVSLSSAVAPSAPALPSGVMESGGATGSPGAAGAGEAGDGGAAMTGSDREVPPSVFG